MPREVNGTEYFSASEISTALDISRQTMWRWRKEGKIPLGRRFRDRQVVFTAKEFEAIREHANRIEPIRPKDDRQLSLFDQT